MASHHTERLSLETGFPAIGRGSAVTTQLLPLSISSILFANRLVRGDYLPEMLRQNLSELADLAKQLVFFFVEPDIDPFYQKDGVFLPHERVAGRLGPYLTRINELQANFVGKSDGNRTKGIGEVGKITGKPRTGKIGKRTNPDIQVRKAFVRELRSKGITSYTEIARRLDQAAAFGSDTWLEKWREKLNASNFNWQKAATHPRTKNYFRSKICNPKTS